MNPEWLNSQDGAKLGQTLRQYMPLNAYDAFLRPVSDGPRNQQPRAYPPNPSTYSYTIGVWEDKSEIGLFISGLAISSKKPGANLGHSIKVNCDGYHCCWPVESVKEG